MTYVGKICIAPERLDYTLVMLCEFKGSGRNPFAEVSSKLLSRSRDMAF